ncbi:UNVERIFIED_CONTAM: hypothetical protein FKN15_040156 [Acipenser sinensis]
MSVNQFEDILAHFHCADNAKLIANDKLAKMRPLFDMMNTQFTAHWPIEQDLDVDEAVLANYGRHSAKQFIRSKPIRWGYKVWCLNTCLGYLVRFDTYTHALCAKSISSIQQSKVRPQTGYRPLQVPVDVRFDGRDYLVDGIDTLKMD